MSHKTDILVGICTKDCEETIRDVLTKVDEGLARFYPKKKSLILISDLSGDRTGEMVRGTRTRSRVIFTKQEGGPGKGNAIRTVFRHAQENGAKAVALVDGDLTSIRPDWIKALVEPIESGYDLAVPSYERHKYDGVITNHLIYPFVTALYGTEIRQPIGGEFGLSLPFIRRLMRHPKFPEGFGIDIFMTTSALAMGMKVAETMLGVKSHTSTKDYKDFERILVSMFNQVVSTLFELTLYNRERLAGVKSVRHVPRFGEAAGGEAPESAVDRKVLFSIFQRDFDKVMNSDVLSEQTKAELSNVIIGSRGSGIEAGTFRNIIGDGLSYIMHRMSGRERTARSDILDEDTKEQVRRFIYGESGQIISVDTWVSAVFEAFRRYRDPEKREEALDVLRAVWMGRFSSFVRQTRFMNTRDAECLIRGQVDFFFEKKGYALEP